MSAPPFRSARRWHRSARRAKRRQHPRPLRPSHRPLLSCHRPVLRRQRHHHRGPQRQSRHLRRGALRLLLNDPSAYGSRRLHGNSRPSVASMFLTSSAAAPAAPWSMPMSRPHRGEAHANYSVSRACPGVRRRSQATGGRAGAAAAASNKCARQSPPPCHARSARSRTIILRTPSTSALRRTMSLA